MTDKQSIERFHNSKIILSLINTSYDKFKEKYPNEEPFWKISCFKKINRRKMANESDLKMNWRQIETTNESRDKPVVTEVKESKLTKEIRVRTINKQQEVRVWEQDGFKDKRITRGKPVVANETITITHSDETFISKAESIDVDINMKYDDPSFITIHKLSDEIKVIEEKIALWGKDFDGTIITNLDVSNIGLSAVIESHKRDLINLKNRVIELENKNGEYLALIMKYQQEKDDQKNNVINFDRLNKVIRKNWTIGEVITKYAETQEKLNEAKTSVTNTLKKHTKLDIDGLYKKHGFIGSFKHVVQYFDSQYDSSDEYDGSDIDL